MLSIAIFNTYSQNSTARTFYYTKHNSITKVKDNLQQHGKQLVDKVKNLKKSYFKQKFNELFKFLETLYLNGKIKTTFKACSTVLFIESLKKNTFLL